MSIEDREKWNKKYQEKRELLEIREPSHFVKKFAKVAKGVDALDLACGVGRNALFLEKIGFRVDAVDISKVALNILKDRSKGSINIIEADLDNFVLDRSYDLILMCNFLDRDLIERSKEYLNSGGVYIVETYIEDKGNQKPNSNSNFLLKRDELLKIFRDEFEVLEYKTFWNESYELYKMRKAVISVRRF